MPTMFALLWLVSGSVSPPSSPQVTIERIGDVYEFKVDGNLVTKYHARKSYSKPYLFPLNGPGGIALSRAWPMEPAGPGNSTDHPHQRSAWFGYGDILPEGVALTSKSPGKKGIDFWEEGINHGSIECTSVDTSEISKGMLRTRNAWKTSEGRTILDEQRDISLTPLEGAYLITVRIGLKSTGSITFADTKEGAFGIRVSDRLCSKNNPKSQIRDATGRTGEQECWGRKADWCDYSGEIDGKTCGIAIFDDGKNRSRACWHVRGYGLLAANPFGRAESGFPAQKVSPGELVRLKSGEELTLRYGILLHVGEPKIAEHYRKFTGQ